MKELIFFVLMIFCLNVYSQQKANVQAMKPSKIVQQELLKKIQEFTEAWAKSDTTTLNKLLAKEYRHSDISGKILHKQDWLTYAAMPRKVSNIISDDIEILLYKFNIAVVTGKMSYLYGEEKVVQEIRFTQIWSKNNSQWKRTTFQATLIDKAK